MKLGEFKSYFVDHVEDEELYKEYIGPDGMMRSHYLHNVMRMGKYNCHVILIVLIASDNAGPYVVVNNDSLIDDVSSMADSNGIISVDIDFRHNPLTFISKAIRISETRRSRLGKLILCN